jgi:hypothetical protein
MSEVVSQLDEPAVRYKIETQVLGRDPDSPEMHQLRESIRQSAPVVRLLSERDADGRIPYDAYAKWDGAHWVLNLLADLGYPPGDESLRPLAEQVYNWLLSDSRVKNMKRLTFAGRTRMCASIEGNAIYFLLALGLADERVDVLAERLLDWQWPDGGWNCDKHKHALHNSSFTETLIPLRGLATYVRHTGNLRAKAVVEQAAEVFLKRRLFRRLHGGEVIDENFVLLHFPCYWHYDILFALKVMHEAGFIHDERCAEALDLLESKRLPDGGFPAEKAYYRVSDAHANGRSIVDWGGTSKKHLNPFVTADARAVLKAAGRLQAGEM